MSGAASHRVVSTGEAPQPVGAYSQAVIAGDFVFVSGLTPRDPDGAMRADLPLRDQVSLVLDNLERIAAAAGCDLRQAVQVLVYLADPADAGTFDEVYRERVSAPLPSRAVLQSGLPAGALELVATFYRPSGEAER